MKRKPLTVMKLKLQNEKSMERAILKKNFSWQKKPTSKTNSHNKSISQITVGSMIKKLALWALKSKIQKEITEKSFKHSFFIDYVDKS